jgi:hypothetical protein
VNPPKTPVAAAEKSAATEIPARDAQALARMRAARNATEPKAAPPGAVRRNPYRVSTDRGTPLSPDIGPYQVSATPRATRKSRSPYDVKLEGKRDAE